MRATMSDAIAEICRAVGRPITPQQIREQIKASYPQFYQTKSQLRNVEKGHYQNPDHALLAQIYIVTGQSPRFICDKTVKPMLISLVNKESSDLKMKTSQPINARPARQKSRLSYNEKVKEIVEKAAQLHDEYYIAETFGGPSLYFHRRALQGWQAGPSTERLELIYATLTSWGMHRMGKGGPKMQEFSDFRSSILGVSDQIRQAISFIPNTLDEAKWELLEGIFKKIQVMRTGTHLVGNSKVMHHLLPNVIPPIDREYTLSFLRNDTNITNDINWEWALMKELISEFFIPAFSNQSFQHLASGWLRQQNEFPWDTSPMKILDNLIIGAKKVN